jgi:DNA-binding SARP family transcriptional activator/transcriptional regulator with XRE-family HTH domain
MGSMELHAGMPDSGFGAVVRAYRHKAGLTQRELATRAGLSVATLRDLEQGRQVRPRRGSLAALPRVLGLDPQQAADMADAMSVPQQRADIADEPDPWPGPPPEDSTRTTGPAGSGQGLRLAVLGPLEAWRDGVPLSLGPPARRAVLGLLTVNPGTLIRRDTFIDVLWGQEPPSTAVNLVQAHVSRLRKQLASWEHSAADGDVIASGRGAYRLRLPREQLDLLVFKELAARAAAAESDGDHLTACDLYAQAVGLWRGDPLADVELPRDLPGLAELRLQLADVLFRYADVACALGWHHQVLPRLQALAVAEPLNEAAHARLMIALAGAGQQAAAIHVYQDMRLRLDRELGVYPGKALVEAHLRVLHQDIPAAASGQARVYRSSSSAAAAAEHLVPRQLPAAPHHFTGRADELSALSGLLDPVQRADAMVIAALTGMAGVGKTALAVHWAHQVVSQFPDGQLFMDLRGFSPSGLPVAPTDVLCGFLTALGVPAARIPPCVAEQAALFRSLLAGRRMLIVLDNVENAEPVRPLLPGSPGSLVLVTSRNRLIGLAAAEGARLVNLGVLTDAESRGLLSKSLGTARAAAEPAAVSEIIALCARLPLALCDAAARAVTHPHLPLAALAAEMRDERQRLDALETGEMATSVRMVFSCSRARLSEPAARMFRFLGLHPGPDIMVPAAASLAHLPRSAAYLALAELCDENLITEHAPGRYAFHDLLRAYAAEAARTYGEAERQAAIRRVLDHYLHTAKAALALLYPYLIHLAGDGPPPGVQPEEMDDPRQAAEWFESERHILFAAIGLAVAEGCDPHAWELPLTVGLFFAGQPHWNYSAADPGSAAAAEDRLLCAPAGLTGASDAPAQHRVADALIRAGQSLRLCRAKEDWKGEVRALKEIGRHLAQLGDYQKAVEYGTHGLGCDCGRATCQIPR